jgi:hypothetical protein
LEFLVQLQQLVEVVFLPGLVFLALVFLLVWVMHQPHLQH